MNKKPLRFLICPLDWGLGHATRCIPIIKYLRQLGAEVIIASDGVASELLKQEFPDLEHLFLHGYRIEFTKSRSIAINLLALIPSLILRVFAEHKQLDEIIKKHDIDVVISDNRYGLWNKKTYSIFITHQPNIIPPTLINFLSPLIRLLTRSFMRKYNECWIPDEAGLNNLSGKLSHDYKLPSNTRYIGLLSRFDMPIHEAKKTYDIVSIISGPEPYRSQLENILEKELIHLPHKSLMLRGRADEGTSIVNKGNLDIANHLSSEKLGAILKSNPIVICRGGYSSLMDLAIFGNKVICIPTPGQTEQEYLSMVGHLNGKLIYAKQDNFDIMQALYLAENTSGITYPKSTDDYKKIVLDLFNMVNKSLN